MKVVKLFGDSTRAVSMQYNRRKEPRSTVFCADLRSMQKRLLGCFTQLGNNSRSMEMSITKLDLPSTLTVYARYKRHAY